MLELFRRIEEVVRIRLGSKVSLVGLLDVVLVTLLLSKANGVLLGLEVDVGALHGVCGRLPADQRVLPAMTLAQNVPIHAPSGAAVGAGLGGGLCRLVYPSHIL